MQKLVAIPYARYHNLIDTETRASGLKKATETVIKNSENENDIQYHQYTEKINEKPPESPKKVKTKMAPKKSKISNFDKLLDRIPSTNLPPKSERPVKKERKKRSPAKKREKVAAFSWKFSKV